MVDGFLAFTAFVALPGVLLSGFLWIMFWEPKSSGEPYIDIDGKEWVVFGRPSSGGNGGCDGGGCG